MSKIKRTIHRFLSLLLSVLLTGSLIPSAALTVWAEGEGGSFVLMALSGGQALIQPTSVSYEPGASLKDALLASGYAFDGLEEETWIHAVQGVTDSYALYYDNGGYDLTVPAETVSGIWITGNYEQGYSDEFLALEKCLAEYREAGDGRQNYAPLAQAAENALAGFWSASPAEAAAYTAEIQQQTEQYDRIIHGETASVTLQVTQDGRPVAPAEAAFTDAYGNTTLVDASAGNTLALTPGDYSFSLSDGGINHVSGNLTVAEGRETLLTAELPSGQWVSEADLGLKSEWDQAVQKTGALPGETVYYVPDYAGGSLYPYVVPASGVDMSSVRLYFGANGTMGSAAKNWNSHTQSVAKAVEKDSLQPATVTIQAVKTGNDGFLQYQEYRLQVLRVPTLKMLEVAAEGTLLPMEFSPDTLEYSLSTVSSGVDVTGTLLSEGAALYVDGQEKVSAAPVHITLPSKGVKDVTVKAVSSDAEREYVLHIEKKASATVEISHASGMQTIVKNAAGAEILPASATNTKDTYHLTPGESYTWIGTKNQYFHTSGSFTAANGGKITAATPQTTHALSSLSAKSTTAASAVIYPFLPDGKGSVHELEVRVGSSKTFFYFNPVVADSAYTVTANYVNYVGNPMEKLLPSGKFTNVASLVNQSGKGAELLLTAAKAADASGVTFYQEYVITVCRNMELTSLSAVTLEGSNVILVQDTAAEAQGFNREILNYKASVPKAAKGLTLTTQLFTSLLGNDTEAVITVSSPEGSGEIRYDGEHQPNEFRAVSVPLNPNRGEEDVILSVSHPDAHAVTGDFVIHVTKLDPVVTTIRTKPADAVVYLTEDLSGERIFPEDDGSWLLSDTLSYTCVITAKGYVGRSESFTCSRQSAALSYTLAGAADREYADLSAEDDWSSFRQGEENNGVTASATPIRSEDAVLMWANKIGDGYGSGATGCPILVGGYLYTYAGTSIVKVDKETGEIVQSGEMAGSSSFAINSPTYAAGMIFVGLSNGRVQAFNAETLESLWVYTDPMGGQANSSITYKDGYVYTGFWNGENKQANFVCLSVTDEDPARTTEEKLPTWRYTDTGFYWAGAYATDRYILVTTDDGAAGSTTGHGSVVSLDPSSGRVLDHVTMPCVGDLRSSICYDAATDACYFTSKGGYFCRIRVAADGSFIPDSLLTMKLSNGADNDTAMSTSTPTIYKGRAYVGVSGSAQFTQYSGHNISVIDLASWSIAYSVPTQGYPQTSGLLTTAYEGNSEYVYVYFLDNFTPGKLRVIRDRAGQTEPDPAYLTKESYTVKNVTYEVDTAYVLFTPSGQQAQYAICSPIVDAEGNLYFKNDSAQLMKLSNIITSLEVKKGPSATEYCQGQSFDPSGIQVVAHYANGSVKDVSSYITAYLEDDQKAEATQLQAGQNSIYLRYDLDKLLKGETGYWTMYHNEAGNPECEYHIPDAELAIRVYEEHTDSNGDGFCDRCGKETVPVPKITEQPQNATALTGDKISLHVTAVNAVSYQWEYSKDGSKWSRSTVASAVTDTLKLTVSETNMVNLYRCKITGPDGSVICTDTVAILPPSPAKILTQPRSQAAEMGSKITFSIEAEGVAEGGYQWQYSKDGSSWKNSTLAAAKTEVLTFTASTSNAGNYYRCRITGKDGKKIYSGKVGYIVITSQPEDCNAGIGQTAKFRTAGMDIVSWQWYYSKNQGDSWSKSTLSSAVTDTISFRVSDSNKNNIYRCKLTDSRGLYAYTESAAIKEGVTILKQPVSVTASTGKKVSFTVQAENVAEGGYQWYYSKDGAKWSKSTLTTAATATLTFTVSAGNSANMYRCRLTGADGSSVYTDTVKITLK